MCVLMTSCIYSTFISVHSFIIFNHSIVLRDKNLSLKAVLYSNESNINFILYIINFNILYTWQIMFYWCVYVQYIQNLYTNIYSVRLAV